MANDANLLPPMRVPSPYLADFSFIRRKQDLYCDGTGASSSFWAGTGVTIDPLWSQSWEDDLIMTNVRSFDIKAYDNAKADYVDLGWGDDARLTGSAYGYLNQTPPSRRSGARPPALYDTYGQTFAHEGRMPPLVEDLRFDAQFGACVTDSLHAAQTRQHNYSGNIGDDQVGIVRLRRVWDSWSTDYSHAPGNGVYLNKGNAADPLNGFPWGPPYSSANLSLVSAALPGAPARHPDPDPRGRPDESAYQDIDDPTGFHG